MTGEDGRSKRSILAGYASVLTGDVGRYAVFALFVPLLVRVVDSGDYGQYALVMATFMLLRKALNLGLFDATKTYAARTAGRDRVEIVVTALAVQVGVLIVALPVLYGASTVLPIDPVLATSLQLVLVTLVGEQLYLFGRGVMHAMEREAFVEALIPVRSVLLAAIGLSLAATGYGVPGVFAGFAVAFLLTGVVAAVVAIRRVGALASTPRPTRAVATRLVRFGVPSMVLVLLTAGLYKIDVFLVSYFMTDTDTGLYRAALQVAEFIWVASLAMEMVMIQTTSELWERGERDRISALLSQMLTYVVVVTSLLIVGVFVLGDEFLGLYFGAEYAESAVPLRILLPGVLGFAVARVVWPVLQAGGHLRGVVAATGVATLANVALNVALIPPFGIAGAAVATSVSYGGMAALHGAVARTVSLRPFAGIPVVRIGATAGLTGLVLVAVNTLLSPLAALLVLPPIGLCVYGAGIFGLGVLSVDRTRAFLTDGLERFGY